MFFDSIGLFTALVLILILLISLCCVFILLYPSRNMVTVQWFDDEKYYLDFSCDPPERLPFPNLKDKFSVYLSVIVPAYNEESRLPVMLDECISYLEDRTKVESDFTYEIIVVDDGSIDDTTKVAQTYSKSLGCEKMRVLTLVKNRGKGGAVRLGMLSSRGKYLLFADADGATKFCDIEKLEKEMKVLHKETENAVVIGSRAHLEKEAIASRSFFRTFLMYGFHALVWLFGVRTVHDTQCGFKLFTRESGRLLFPNLHVERWAFDVELLYLASQMDMLIREIAVAWTEIEGSKLVPVWSWLQMGKDLVLIWLKYQTGFWNIPIAKKNK